MRALCKDCLFWVPIKGRSEGECHRYAPRPEVMHEDDKRANEEETLMNWPSTQGEDFCGEWVERRGDVRKSVYDRPV